MSIPTPGAPVPPEPSKKSTSRIRLVAGIVVLAVTAVCLIAVFVNMLGGEEPGSDSTTAEIMCERFIERELVSPATAEYTHEETSFDDPAYTVVGYVDSENALGAMLRSEYTCIVEPTGGDEWRLEFLDLQEV